MATLKLNNSMREAFVRAVLDDMPLPDDDECSAHLMKLLTPRMPEEVKNVLKLCPEWLEDRRQSIHISLSVGKEWNTQSVMFTYKWFTWGIDELPQDAQDYIGTIREELDKIEQFKNKLIGATKACSTVKQLRDMFPELEKYMPEDASVTKNLPVCSNLMAEAVALGWPKGKKNAEANHA